MGAASPGRMAERGGRYGWVTDEMFRAMLEEVLDDESGSSLLAVPGLYEVVSEHFNNEVLERLGWEHPEKAAEAAVPDLPRDACVDLLESVSIACRDEEPVEVLREAVLVNLRDGTLDANAVLRAAPER